MRRNVKMMTELFTPAKIGNCVIPNRLIVPAMFLTLRSDQEPWKASKVT